VDVLTVDLDLALDSDPLDQIVHAIETAQQARFAAAGRPDERRDLAFDNVHVDVEQGALFPVPQVQIVHPHLDRIFEVWRGRLDGRYAAQLFVFPLLFERLRLG
jgi:hypothetical protein